MSQLPKIVFENKDIRLTLEPSQNQKYYVYNAARDKFGNIYYQGYCGINEDSIYHKIIQALLPPLS